MKVQKDNNWYKAQLHRMIEMLEDNEKLHFIWTIVRKYVMK